MALVGWDAVGAPIEGIDGEGFAAGWDDERICDFRRFAVERNDDAGVCFACRKAHVWMLGELVFCDAPADGVAGDELIGEGVVVEIILQEAQHKIAALGKSGEDDRPAVVIIGEVILKGVLDILVGGAQRCCTLVFRQAVGIEAGLAVIGRKKTAVGVVDALFHVGGAEKICLCIGVVEGHVFCILCAGVDGRADEEHIGCGVCALRFVIGPVFRCGVVHAVCFLLGAAGKKHEAEQERCQENVVFVVSLFHAITFLK